MGEQQRVVSCFDQTTQRASLDCVPAWLAGWLAPNQSPRLLNPASEILPV